jgi:hypothetical protein
MLVLKYTAVELAKLRIMAPSPRESNPYPAGTRPRRQALTGIPLIEGGSMLTMHHTAHQPRTIVYTLGSVRVSCRTGNSFAYVIIGEHKLFLDGLAYDVLNEALDTRDILQDVLVRLAKLTLDVDIR